MPASDTSPVARTVLLADDNPTIQRVVELTFAGENINVVAVDDGARAIDTIRQSPPDVVLADIGMPGRSGYDVLAFVRSQPSLSHVPVLLLAGAFEPVDKAQAARLGADGVLSKPFEPATLVHRVTELLAQRREPPQPAIPAPPCAADRDRYFEEIDQAFAALSQAPRPPLTAAREAAPADDALRGDAVEDGAPDASPQADLSVPEEVDRTDVPLTDAFAALLEAEQTGTPIERLWPQTPESAAPPSVDIDRLADMVARRVLQQLTDRAVRDTVSEIVSSTAERLVREEIERIKRHIK